MAQKSGKKSGLYTSVYRLAKRGKRVSSVKFDTLAAAKKRIDTIEGTKKTKHPVRTHKVIYK